MIFEKEAEWKRIYSKNLLRKDCLILDLSLFPNLNAVFIELSNKVNIPQSTLYKQFVEIVVDICNIKDYTDAIIVPIDSFKEMVEKPILQGLNKLENKSIFDHLVNRYEGELHVGIDIPVSQIQEFPPSFIEQDQISKAKIFSVRLHVKDLKKLLFLKNMKFKIGVQVFHFNFTLTSPEDLIEIQRFFVKEEFPIESIILTTNLLSVIKIPEFAKEVNISIEKGSAYNIAYHHNLYLQRYLSDAYFNILDYYEIPYQKAIICGDKPEDDTQPTDKILKILLQVQRAKSKQKDFLGGFVVSPNLFLPSLKKFFGGYDCDLTLAGEILRYSMAGYKQILNGTFKTLKPKMLT